MLSSSVTSDAASIPPELLKKYQEAAGDHQKKPRPERSARVDTRSVANLRFDLCKEFLLSDELCLEQLALNMLLCRRNVKLEASVTQ